jgi:hypothetical protein
MKAFPSLAVAVATLVGGWSSPVRAEVGAIGTVTAVEGQVMAARAAAPQPVALTFKDPLFPEDRIATGDHGVARLLLGSSATLTVRERSGVTLTDGVGHPTIGVIAGTVGLAVLGERLQPGQEVDVRTPNVSVTAGGTVGVVVVRPRPIVETVLIGMRGQFVARIGSRSITVGPGQTLRVTGTVPVLEAAPAPVLADARRVFQPIGLQLRQVVDAERLKSLTAAPLKSGELSATATEEEADLTRNVRAKITEEAVTRYLVPAVTPRGP